MRALTVAYALSVALLSAAGQGNDFWISNHTDFPGRKVVVDLVGKTNFTYDAKGKPLTVREPAIALHLKNCRNVTIRNLSIDWARPVLTEARIVEFRNWGTRVAIDGKRYPFAVEDGRLIVTGPGRREAMRAVRFLDGRTFEPVPLTADEPFRETCVRAEPDGTVTIMADYSHQGVGLKVGDILVFRPFERPYPAVFVEDSSDVVFEDMIISDAYGMGLVAQMSENIVWRGSGRAEDKTSGVVPRRGSHVTTHADASHFSNCGGQVTVENCWFEGMMDDAINVHSTCVQITDVLSRASVRCAFRHPDAIGFALFRPGSSARLIRSQTNEDGPVLSVVAVRRIADDTVELDFAAELPAGFGIGDVVENADFQCAATFRSNVVKNNRARGVLFTTPKKVICSSNRFERCCGSAVVLAGDAASWFESGHCRDVEIVGNVISNCLSAGYGRHGSAFGVISIDPVVGDLVGQNDYCHGNVRIVGNEIFTHDATLLFARSATGLVWSNNVVHVNADLPSWHRPKFVLERCGTFAGDSPEVREARSGRTVTRLSGAGWTFDGRPVTVPHTWNAVDAADGVNTMKKNPGTSVGSPSYCRGAHTYRRSLPAPKAGKRYFVRCEGVSSKAELRVNEEVVGCHYGAFTAFAFEITEFLKPAGNELAIVADNSYDRDVPPISGDFSLFGGVYRDVWLIETDPVCISPLVDGGPGVILEPDPDTGKVVARVSVLGDKDEVQEFSFSNHELWSPENPKLYTVTIRLDRPGGKDVVTQTFGFRKVEFREDGFYLNGKRRQIRGVCMHQDREGKGWAVSAADLAEDVEWLKRMGADGLRTAHYPHATRLYDLCDNRGVMVWTEVPAIDELEFTAAFRSNLLVVAREMVAQHRNHPSVVMWGLYNELFGEGGRDMPMDRTVALVVEVNDLIKRADPSRPTVSAGCDATKGPIYRISDAQGFNLYPGWYNLLPWYEGDGGWDLSNAVRRVMATMPKRRCMAVSEYGAGASVTQHGDPFAKPRIGIDPYPEEYQAYLHWGALYGVQDDPRIWGVYPWVMFDLAADRRHEADRHGINNKGLVTYDRRTAKDAFYLYKANWNPEPELHLVGSRMTTLTNATVNVMAFSNVGDVTLSVNGRIVGVAKPDRVRTCCWRDVPLSMGLNHVEVRAEGRVRRAEWMRVEIRKEKQEWN